MKRKRTLFIIAVLSSVSLAAGVTFAKERTHGRMTGEGGIIYVASQDLYYDTIGLNDLPPHGRFQQLWMGGPNGATGMTTYGPGDTGYLGGRWWVDVNGNHEMDEGDKYFLCPLLGPGRTSP
jgi:hypothetical protein